MGTPLAIAQPTSIALSGVPRYLQVLLVFRQSPLLWFEKLIAHAIALELFALHVPRLAKAHALVVPVCIGPHLVGLRPPLVHVGAVINLTA